MSLNVRKLVALDMVFLGARVIVAEYAAGVILCGTLGLFSLRQGLRLPLSWQLLLGIVLLWIAINYVPLFLHAVDLSRRGTARQEVAGELADPRSARSYSWRQLWILVPFAIVVLAIAQRPRSGATRQA